MSNGYFEGPFPRRIAAISASLTDQVTMACLPLLRG